MTLYVHTELNTRAKGYILVNFYYYFCSTSVTSHEGSELSRRHVPYFIRVVFFSPEVVQGMLVAVTAVSSHMVLAIGFLRAQAQPDSPQEWGGDRRRNGSYRG